MKMIPVTSSHITAIGYEAGKLHVSFASGRKYSYEGPGIAEHFKQMSGGSGLSVGGYFSRHIRSNPEIIATEIPTE